MKELSKSKNVYIRRWIAGYPMTPMKIINGMRDDADLSVRDSVNCRILNPYPLDITLHDFFEMCGSRACPESYRLRIFNAVRFYLKKQEKKRIKKINKLRKTSDINNL